MRSKSGQGRERHRGPGSHLGRESLNYDMSTPHLPKGSLLNKSQYDTSVSLCYTEERRRG